MFYHAQFRNLPSEVVQRSLLRTPFSREEEDAIINAGIRSNAPTVSLADFDRLLSPENIRMMGIKKCMISG